MSWFRVSGAVPRTLQLEQIEFYKYMLYQQSDVYWYTQIPKSCLGMFVHMHMSAYYTYVEGENVIWMCTYQMYFPMCFIKCSANKDA